MNRSSIRLALWIALVSLALGGAINIGVSVWMCLRTIAFEETLLKSYPEWPSGSPSSWSMRPKSWNRISRPGVVIESWEQTADRGFVNQYYTAAASFTDRRIAQGTRRMASGRESDPLDDPAAKRQQAALIASQKAALDTILASIEDRSAIQIAAGWPYPSFRGTYWVAHGYNPATLKWISRTVATRGVVAFGPAPTEAPWPGIFPWHPAWPGFAANTFTYGIPVAAVIAGFLMLRRRFRTEAGCCPACGYPVGWAERCTECGRPGPIWSRARLDRLERRKRPARPRPFMLLFSLLLIGITIASAYGATAELKVSRAVIGIGGGALVVGVSQSPWRYPGPAAYMAPSNLAIVPRVSTIGGAFRMFVPLWPAVTILVCLVARRSWHHRICRAARDIDREQVKSAPSGAAVS